MPAEKPSLPRPSEARRSNKPVMEKRRRARINQCLNELKALILEALRKDPSRHTKLEKADILEMTVKHLQNMQRHQMAVAMASDPTVLNKFRSGFTECASEVSRYVNRIEVDSGVKQRLVAHLANCVSHLTTVGPLAALSDGVMATAALATALNMTVSPFANFNNSNNNNNNNNDNNNNNNLSATRLLNSLSLIPGRLLSGDIALLLSRQSGSLPGGFSQFFANSSASATTPSATITQSDKASAFTAVSRSANAGLLSPISITSSGTSGSSGFSPTLRESSSPEGQPSFESPRTVGPDLVSRKSVCSETSSIPHPDANTQASASTESERMWRPW
uniref:BHLH domain-containing protein n=1 Tax=Strigamia maritima TaxID=126957 RepID=T1JGI3_STRMM